MVPVNIDNAFFVLLKSGLLLVTIPFCSSIFVKISISAFNMYFLSMSYINFYGLLHCLPPIKFECSTHSQARVSRSILQFIYSSASSILYLSLILRAYWSSKNFFAWSIILKRSSRSPLSGWQSIATILKCFRIVLVLPPVAKTEAHKNWRSTERALRVDRLQPLLEKCLWGLLCSYPTL